MQRLKLVCDIYKLWINKKDKNVNVNFYDALQQGFNFNNKYSFDHVLKDFRYIIKNSHLLIADNDQQESQDNKPTDLCTADDCYILNRSDRDKTSYRENHGDLARLFCRFQS